MMLDSVERTIVRRLSDDPEWASSSVGRLASYIVDYEIPIHDVAKFLNVRDPVLRRWLYGYGSRDNPTVRAPGGGPAMRQERAARVERLLFLVKQVGWARGMSERWIDTLEELDRNTPAEVE